RRRIPNGAGGAGIPVHAVGCQIYVLAHLSRWLDAKGLAPEDLVRLRVLEFLEARRSAGYTLWLSEKGVAPLLSYLRCGFRPIPYTHSD
ncbi:MAG: hypothetical protein ACRDYC_10465, partial [Acidimicrobiales bacterium]